MEVKLNLVLSLVITSLFIFSSCSREDIFADVVHEREIDSEIDTRTVSDIFDVERIYLSETQIWSDGPRGVDSKGNIYLTLYDDSPEGGHIYKYDMSVGTINRFAPLMYYGAPDCERFCFDEKDNLCYLAYNPITRSYGIRRVRADGNAVTEQWFDGTIIPSSMTTALNGNIFILASSSQDDSSKIYKLTPNGIVSDIGVDLTNVYALKALYKASGTTLYLSGDSNWYREDWYRINTNTASINGINLRNTPHMWERRLVTSSNTKANLYTIKDNCIVQLRPNAATDSVIGSIPSYFKDKNGQFVSVDINEYSEIYMNSDASVFYAINGYCELYKLTLN